MIADDLTDVPIDVFGGYCPAVPPSDLPSGAANVAQDVQFPQAAVRTRGGLRNYVFTGAAIPVGAAINGLKTYLTPTGGQRLMIWDSLGDMFYENPEGTLNLINSRPYEGLFYQSQTLFGREYQAFFDASGGFDIPRQYDSINWDRVSQVGPGSAPLAVESPVLYALAAAPIGLQTEGPYNIQAAPAGLTSVGNVVTLKAIGLFPFFTSDLRAGDSIVIAGATNAAYDGTWVILSIGASSLTFIHTTSGLPASGGGTMTTGLVTVSTGGVQTGFFTGQSVVIAGAGVGGYDGTWVIRGFPGISTDTSIFQVAITNYGLANSGSGTVAAAGNIAAGLHQVSLAFVTRQGLITQAAPPNSWTATGSNAVQLTDIATGPPNIVARLVLFTPVITAPATTGNFYSLPTAPVGSLFRAMLIDDNTTTSASFDFVDSVLIAGFQANYLFTQLELGESADTLGYNSRTVWLGERARTSNLLNLSFDGGFAGNLPRGWNGTGVGGGSALAAGLPTDWMDAYVITGDGVTATRGEITQSAYQDYLGVPIIRTNVSYSVRVRVRKTANALTAGTFTINLQSASTGFSTTGLRVQFSDVTQEFQEFIQPLLVNPLGSVPSDLLLHVFATNTPTNNGQFIADSIEIFSTNTPYNSSVARISHAFNPESFDSVTGQVQVRPGDGQQLRAGFPLRNSLYLAKDHYLGYVTDDGTNEPSSWTFTEVSATIGICGPNAVDWTEEWAVFAERSGLYLCWGGDPAKITQEIQIDASFSGRVSWESINWSAAHTIWVRIDQRRKMIMVGAPINGATSPNVVFMMDYRWLDSAEDIANGPMVSYSGYTGKILGHGRGRRWALWNITANSMCFAERTNGTAEPFFGNGAGNGKLYQQFDCAQQASDDGVAIASAYQTYAVPSSQEEQAYQLRAHRKLAGYLKFRAWGVGTLGLAIGTDARSTLLRGYTLSLNPTGDGERPLNLQAERFYINLNTSAVGSYFQLEKLIICMRKSATALVRGLSA